MKKYFWLFSAIVCGILSFLYKDGSYMVASLLGMATFDILDVIETKKV